jgi:hypothetical protein
MQNAIRAIPITPGSNLSVVRILNKWSREYYGKIVQRRISDEMRWI